MLRLPTFVSVLVVLVVLLFTGPACTPRETELVARTAHAAACAYCSATEEAATAEDAAAAYSKALREVTEAIGRLAAAVDPEEVAALRAELAASQERERVLFARMVALARKAPPATTATAPTPAATPSSTATSGTGTPAPEQPAAQAAPEQAPPQASDPAPAPPPPPSEPAMREMGED